MSGGEGRGGGDGCRAVMVSTEGGPEDILSRGHFGMLSGKILITDETIYWLWPAPGRVRWEPRLHVAPSPPFIATIRHSTAGVRCSLSREHFSFRRKYQERLFTDYIDDGREDGKETQVVVGEEC